MTAVANRLAAALELMLENTDTPPDRNCGCHISAPCGNCSYNGLREAIEMAEAALAAHDEAVKADANPDTQPLPESDRDAAVAQAVEFATYVERQAKGAMVDAAKRFLSLPYSVEIAGRLADANRYRWLRNEAYKESGMSPAVILAEAGFPVDDSRTDGFVFEDELDERVDAAMGAKA